jgi:hypothetical protein
MFGYIRPVQGELLVKEYELYRAVYCGLCRYGGKHISHFTRFFLNYDFVALALLRLALTDEKPTVEQKYCPYHLKKKNTLCADSSYDLTCSAFAILLYYKAVDDINDSKGIKRLIKTLSKPFFAVIKRKVKGCEELELCIKDGLDKLDKFEKAKESKLDMVADCFAKITQDIASFGLTGNKKLIASQCGYHIGRYIYLIDAYDDIFDDEKNGSYNPFLIKYGTAGEVLNHADEIKTTIIDSLNAFSSVYGLNTIENGENSSRIKDYDNILFNISELGGRAALNKVHSQRDKRR